MRCITASQSSPPAGGESIEIIFSGGVYVGENTAQSASVRIARLRRALVRAADCHPLPENRMIFRQAKKNDASRRHFFMFDWDYKPGSVIDSHLSRRSVAAALKPPPRKRPGRPYASSTVLHRIEFTAPQCSHAAGELLPRLSTLTPRAGRYFSVALFLKSPSAGVTRYPCPVVPGLSSHGRFSAQMRGCPSQSCLFYFILAEMSNGLQNLSRADIIWE